MLEECLTLLCAFPFTSKQTSNSLDFAFGLVDASNGMLQRVLQMKKDDEEKKCRSNHAVK